MATEINSRPCKICMVQHDDEIHAATLSVHQWFRDQVVQGFWDEVTDVLLPVEDLAAPQVA
jgi:hypothetical protein